MGRIGRPALDATRLALRACDDAIDARRARLASGRAAEAGERALGEALPGGLALTGLWLDAMHRERLGIEQELRTLEAERTRLLERLESCFSEVKRHEVLADRVRDRQAREVAGRDLKRLDELATLRHAHRHREA